jgi:curved DNA-binding protein CbpA
MEQGMHDKDYYAVLGVAADADPPRIKNAYRELALRYHPDRNRDDPAAAERMKAVNEAYAVLSNPDRRREYDGLRSRFGAAAASRFRHTVSPEDLFRNSDIARIFEEMTRAYGLRGYEEIFREFYGAGFRAYEVQRPGFRMRGFVFTGRPPGAGGRMRNQGPGGPRAGGAGLGRLAHLLLGRLTGIQLPREGSDLVDSIALTAAQAVAGGPYAYLHRPRNKKLVVQVPPGVRHGQMIRLAGLGQPGQAGGRDGDLFLRVRVRDGLWTRLVRWIGGWWRRSGHRP